MTENALENLFVIEEPTVEKPVEDKKEPETLWEKGIVTFGDVSETEEDEEDEEEILDDKKDGEKLGDQGSDENIDEEKDPELLNFTKEVLEEPLVQNLIEEQVETRIKDVEENFLSDLDDEAKMFFEFKKAGGSTKEFLSLIGNTDKVKIVEDTAVAKTFLNDYLQTKGINSKVVSTAIENMSEEELMETYKSSVNEYNINVETNVQNLVQQQKQKEEESRKANEENVRAITDYFTKTTVIAGKKLPLNARKELVNDLTRTNSNGLSNFQTKLMEIVNAKDERLAALAYLLKKDMKLDDILKSSTTKATGDIKKKLSEYRKSSPAKNSKKKVDKKKELTIKDIENFFN